jgi:hypothetical protein
VLREIASTKKGAKKISAALEKMKRESFVTPFETDYWRNFPGASNSDPRSSNSDPRTPRAAGKKK